MSRNGRIVLTVVVVLVVVAAISGAYIWFSGGSGQASQPLSAPTIDPNTISQNPTAVPTSAATAEATSAASATAEATAAAAAQTSAGVLFNIVPEKSEVSFTIYEKLRGQDNNVVGKTNQVAGQIFVNFDNPAQSQVGTIRVDVRSLATDEEFRNRTMRTAILQSNQEQFEFSDFKPTSLEGLPASITLGQPVTFKLNGDLTIRNITQPVTFDATVTPTSKTELSGSATAKVTRTQYQLTIPNVPFVADVGDEVTLKIDFVAQAAS